MIDVSDLDAIIKKFQPAFDKVDQYGVLLQEGVYSSGVEFKQLLNELCGIFVSLKPISKVLEIECENLETREFNMMRVASERKGEKFVAGVAERMAKDKVSLYRRTWSQFQGYVDVCQVLISSCQSVLKYLGEESRLIRQGD